MDGQENSSFRQIAEAVPLPWERAGIAYHQLSWTGAESARVCSDSSETPSLFMKVSKELHYLVLN